MAIHANDFIELFNIVGRPTFPEGKKYHPRPLLASIVCIVCIPFFALAWIDSYFGQHRTIAVFSLFFSVILSLFIRVFGGGAHRGYALLGMGAVLIMLMNGEILHQLYMFCEDDQQLLIDVLTTVDWLRLIKDVVLQLSLFKIVCYFFAILLPVKLAYYTPNEEIEDLWLKAEWDLEE